MGHTTSKFQIAEVQVNGLGHVIYEGRRHLYGKHALSHNAAIQALHDVVREEIHEMKDAEYEVTQTVAERTVLEFRVLPPDDEMQEGDVWPIVYRFELCFYHVI